jgi:hypothetical protein
LAVGHAIGRERLPLLLAETADGLPTTIQIAREGQWLLHSEGPFKLTVQTFEEVIANHQRYGVDPFFDREHESLFYAAPVESRGWARELFVRPDPADASRAALFARVEWTDIGALEVGRKYFRYVSMGIDLTAKDTETGAPIGARLIQIALCKNPFIKGMQPLSLTDESQGEEERTMALKLGAETLKALALKDGAPEEALEPAILALAQKAARADQLDGELRALKAELAQAAEREIEREVDAAVEAGKVTPAERPQYLRLAQRDRELFRELVAKRETQRPTPVAQPPKERTLHDDTGRQSEQSRLIAEYRKQHEGVSFSDALVACAERHPALFRELTAPIAVGSGALEGEG